MPNTSRKKKEKKDSLYIAVLFCIGVLVIVCIAFLLKAVSIVSKSNFTGSNRFTVVVVDSQPLRIITASAETNTLTALTVKKGKNVDKKSVGKLLKIPIDGTIAFREQINGRLSALSIMEARGIDNVLWQYLLNFNTLQTNLTILDMTRLWWFARSIPTHSITLKTVSLPLILEPSDELNNDRLMVTLFNEKSITDENMSIHVVNGTGVFGLGNRLARLITNIGGNVIAVTTADSLIEQTEIVYRDVKNYTVEKLSKVIRAPAKKAFEAKNKSNSTLSDIIIYLGKDSVILDSF